jgi:hypothetical protein
MSAQLDFSKSDEWLMLAPAKQWQEERILSIASVLSHFKKLGKPGSLSQGNVEAYKKFAGFLAGKMATDQAWSRQDSEAFAEINAGSEMGAVDSVLRRMWAIQRGIEGGEIDRDQADYLEQALDVTLHATRLILKDGSERVVLDIFDVHGRYQEYQNSENPNFAPLNLGPSSLN